MQQMRLFDDIPDAEPWLLDLDASDIKRLLQALLCDELERLTHRSVPPDVPLAWDATTRLDEDGIGFDSLALLQVCSRVNQFFHLHEVGIEDYLFVRRTLGDWIEIVARALGMRFDRLTFQTSGSTGSPKACTHSVAALSAELVEQAKIFRSTRRILSLVPCHHIYGFLFAVALPKRLEVASVDMRSWSPGKQRQGLRPGDLIVATPFQWRALLASLGRLPAGLTGVTSTSPMPAELRARLAQANLYRLVEIYGSSETAGVGYREAGDDPFRLFAFWRWNGTAGELVRATDGEHMRIQPQDRLDFSDETCFRPAGRTDGAVQVGGQNVHPGNVADVIRQHPDVADCTIRLDGVAPTQRLKAFIALRAGLEGSDTAQDSIRAHIKTHLSAAARPVAITFGSDLPKTAMGKNADW